MGKRYFTPRLFQFLEDLADNNTRDWFKANQETYEEVVREPALEFINDVGDAMKPISKHIVADSRKVGGSLFRIQRDTRFAKDKTPYKENTGMHFRHVMAKDVHAPGFYINLQPRMSYMGMGIWKPETKAAYQIREAIAAKPAAWKKASQNKAFLDTFEVEGDSLKRPPRGYHEDHPLIEDLKRKDFIASRRLTQKQVTSTHFLDDFMTYATTGSPYMKFLCKALGLQF